MDRHTIILTADKRQEKLLSLLGGEKIGYPWEKAARQSRLCEKVYVLPIPVSKLEENQQIKEKLKKELISLADSENIFVKVFGGVFNEEWHAFFQELQIPYWDFMELPEVVEGNGWITAEGVLAEVLQMGQFSVCGQKVLVTGYGCCGEKIARLFSNIGAEVIVAVRREAVRHQIELDGLQAVSFEEMPRIISDMNTVINTVPAMVITEDCIRCMSKEAIIVDIASKPGGCDFEAAKKYGVSAKLALGLPGIYTTASSAGLLKDAISRYAPLQNDIGEGNVWIFQIII